jgi:hypothetical protein
VKVLAYSDRESGLPRRWFDFYLDSVGNNVRNSAVKGERTFDR